MTAQSAIPLKWYVPFANGDSSRVELPVTTADPTRASQTLGFPPLTMQPPESGGVPPQGEDFNGGMNQVARIAWWVLNGGGWPFDATFATNSNINGYPNGATLQSADFRGDWINTADNNQNNPDTNGTNWVPGFQYGVTALTGLTGGTVTPTPAQAAKNSITLAGTLGSALTIVLPTWTKNWTITNNTTGAFVTIVKTAAGSGVTIPQNSSPTRVSGDGTNIVQAPENIAAATSATQPLQLGQALGRLLRVTTISNTGTFTPGAGTNAVLVRLVGGGGAGGGAPATGAGQVSVGSGGASGAYSEGYFTSGFAGVTVTIGAAGVAASGTAGGAGGASSFGVLLTAPGGPGGVVAGPATPPFQPVGPNFAAAGTGGNLNSPGGVPSLAFAAGTGCFIGGPGASTPLAQGAAQISTNTNGVAAAIGGAGGGGTQQQASGSALTGGAGGKGLCIIYELS